MSTENIKDNINLNNTKQDNVSITYEEIGLFPRSFSRVLDRFLKQLFSDVENLVIQEYRFYRYLFLTTLKCLLILFFVPFLVNFVSKNYLLHPLIQYIWNNQQTEIFLNSYQQKRAFVELKDFEEKLYFESLIAPSLKTAYKFAVTDPLLNENKVMKNSVVFKDNGILGTTELLFSPLFSDSTPLFSSASAESPLEEGLLPFSLNQKGFPSFPLVGTNQGDEKEVEKQDKKELNVLILHPELEAEFQSLDLNKLKKENSKKEFFEQKLQEKTINLADHYNNLSIEAITNFFADLLSLITLCYLIVVLEIQLNITKSFLLEVFFGLDDSKKSLLILLITDLLVGYHSSNLWELFFEFIFNHYGLPESQTGIFLLVATLPVLLDVLFKYLIFRHLNRSSPATVATYHAMIE